MAILLYDNKGNPFQADNEDDAKTLLSTGKAGFADNQNVSMIDGEGNPINVEGKFASSYLFDKNYHLTSQEELNKTTKEETYQTPTQQAMTAGESIINTSLLGFGKALEIKAGKLLKGDEYANKLRESINERERLNLTSGFLGDVTGIALDPIGAYSMLGKAGKLAGAGVAGIGEAATALKAPEMLTGLVTGKIAQKAVGFGLEGSVIGGMNETGRELRDDKGLNAEAIFDSAKEGGVFGAVLGAGVGALEQTANTALNLAKKIAKSHIDKITGALPEESGEIFKSTNRMGLKPEETDIYGTGTRPIELIRDPDGSYHYNDGQRSGVIGDIPDTANKLDLQNPTDVENFGKQIKVNDVGSKIRFKPDNQNLSEFLGEEVQQQQIINKLDTMKPYMPDHLRRLYDSILDTRKEFGSMLFPEPMQLEHYQTIKGLERNIFNELDQNKTFKFLEDHPEEAQRILDINKEKVSKIIDSYDIIESFNQDGQSVAHILNPEILPETVNLKIKDLGTDPLTFEARQMVGQLRPTQTSLRRLGNKRINEVMDFILDHYPKEGSFFKKGTTSIDYIQDKLFESKTNAVAELNDVISNALNIKKAGGSLTYEDMANYIEHEFSQKFIEKISKNPGAGETSQYKQVIDFANELRQNGYTINKMGVREYQKLSTDQIRNYRIHLDKNVINYNKVPGQYTAVEDAAHSLRGWLEDEVMGRVKDVDKGLFDRYVVAKKTYQNATDAIPIITGAINKGLTKSGFDLKYSMAGSMLGLATGSAPLSVATGLGAGYARGVMRDYSGSLSVFLTRSMGDGVANYEKMIDSSVKKFFSPVEGLANIINRIPKDNDKDIIAKDAKRLGLDNVNPTDYANNFMDKNEFMFSQFPITSQKLLNTNLAAKKFLASKIPQNPFAGNPIKQDSWQPSQPEISKYFRYRDAIVKPSSILGQIKNGYVTPEAAEVLAAVYPETKNALAIKFMENIDKAKNIPIQKRQELYKIFDIKLDSFNNPNTFMDFQVRANGQVQESIQENSGVMKPNNALKIKQKEMTTGNNTIKRN